MVKIAKCEEQQNNVRNNREYDSLSKEIDYQKLEIELCDKKIAEHTAQIAAKKEEIENSKTYVEDRKIDLKQKKSELNEIIAETKQEEERLMQKGKECEEKIEESLLKWKKDVDKKPLLIYGNKQVGKTYTVLKFGEENYKMNYRVSTLKLVS